MFLFPIKHFNYERETLLGQEEHQQQQQHRVDTVPINPAELQLRGRGTSTVADQHQSEL